MHGTKTLKAVHPQHVDKPVDNFITQRNVTSQYVRKALYAFLRASQEGAGISGRFPAGKLLDAIFTLRSI
jgi:hypothetical protein